jgi:hypothetical protein
MAAETLSEEAAAALPSIITVKSRAWFVVVVVVVGRRTGPARLIQ